MQGTPGIRIGKALRAFTKAMWPGIMNLVSDAKKGDEDWCIWHTETYRETMKALMELHDFAGDKNKADAYLCGYYRGLQKAAFKLRKR